MIEHITPAQYKAMGKRKNKFGAKTAYRCEDCGGWANKVACLSCQSQKVLKFASMGEAKRYDVLRARFERGEIFNLELQPVYRVYMRGKLICKVILDFRYLENGRMQIEDFKGKDTSMSKLKRKMVEAAYGFKVEVIK